MPKFKHATFKNVSVGQFHVLNKRGKLKNGAHILRPVNRRPPKKKKTAPTSTFGRDFSEWDRGDLEKVFESLPHINIDQFIENSNKRPSKKSRKKGRRKRDYKQKRRNILESWTQQRKAIISTYISGEVHPSDALCVECSTLATHRCLECGRGTHYCDSHVKKVHEDCLHVPEIWKDGFYQAVEIIDRMPWTRSDGHFETCCSQKISMIVVVDSVGRQHKVPVAVCSHEAHGITLIRHRLWPSTITRPEVAFEFSLMDWMETMYFESHVACRSLSQALKLMGSKLPHHVKNIHELLTKETFSEFRLFKQQLRDLKFACPDLAQENTCPACPKVSGTRVMSLDAIFGLKRWKKAKGISVSPKHGQRMFEDQQVVDKYVQEHKQKEKEQKEKPLKDIRECNSFQAADTLRAKIKSSKVDETGIFGSVCRHEVPWRFWSLREGESYGNSVYMIELLLKDVQTTTSCNVLVMYDIACLLTRHLQKHDDKRHLLDKVTMAVPAFHIYGHKPSCQIEYSPRRIQGFGLSDGEQTERLWAFLRNFAKITREMTPENRIDSLTEALLHYSRNAINQIGELLVMRFDRAKATKTVAEKELADALTGNEGTRFMKTGQVQMWAAHEKASLSKKKKNVPKKLTTEDKYVELLAQFYSAKQDLLACSDGDEDQRYILQQVRRLEENLKKMEKNKRNTRWESNNPTYTAKLKKLTEKKQLDLLNRINGMSCERWFLLQLKKRYADGQTMAQRIARQITAQTNKIKKAVKIYNQEQNKTSLPSKLTLEQAYTIDHQIWQHLQDDKILVGNGTVPTYVKRTLIDLHHRIERCEEELILLKEEMGNTLSFYRGQVTIVNEYIKQTASCSVKALLFTKQSELRARSCHLEELYKDYIDVAASSVSEMEVTTEVPASTSTTEVPASTSTIEVPTEVPASTSTTEVPASTSTTEVPARSSTTEVPARSSTAEEEASSSTTEVEASTNTPEVEASISVEGEASSDDSASDSDGETDIEDEDHEPLDRLTELLDLYDEELSSAESDVE